MTFKEKIKNELAQNPGLTDTQLERKFNVLHQAVNKACRDLEQRGELRRDKSVGVIKNFLEVSSFRAKDESKKDIEGKHTHKIDDDSRMNILSVNPNCRGNETISLGKYTFF